MKRKTTIVALARGLLCVPAAFAGDAHGRCDGFIDALPARIDVPGTWCLRQDLAAKPQQGPSAIVIAADDVTLECRGFVVASRPRNLLANQVGVSAYNRRNVTLRHCTLRHFWIGAVVAGGTGHVLEDNLVDRSLYLGLYARSEHTIIQRNRILDTGGSRQQGFDSLAIAIDAAGDIDIVDNVIVGVAPFSAPAQGAVSSLGITATGGGGTIARNRVRGLVPRGDAPAFAIWVGNGVYAERTNVHDNDLYGPAGIGMGILCFGPRALVTGNRINGFLRPVDAACTAIDNMVVP